MLSIFCLTDTANHKRLLLSCAIDRFIYFDYLMLDGCHFLVDIDSCQRYELPFILYLSL